MKTLKNPIVIHCQSASAQLGSLCISVGIFLWKKFGKTLLDMKTNIK
jgi:hypothetical protein